EVDVVRGRVPLGAAEQHVLHEVAEAVVLRALEAGTGLDVEDKAGGVQVRELDRDHAQPTWQDALARGDLGEHADDVRERPGDVNARVRGHGRAGRVDSVRRRRYTWGQVKRGSHRAMLLKKIVVAEDDDAIAHLINMALGDAGFLCLRARDGAEAINLVRVHAPDLLVLDVMTPRVSGHEVARKLKGDV